VINKESKEIVILSKTQWSRRITIDY